MPLKVYWGATEGFWENKKMGIEGPVEESGGEAGNREWPV